MRHTNTLLRADKGPTGPITTPDDVAQRRRELDSMAAHAAALRNLQRDEGWQIFIQECQREELILLARIENAVGDQLAKLVGTLLAVRSFQTFAQDRAQELEATILEASAPEPE